MTPATVEGAGVELAYEEHGSGEPLVLVHGLAAGRALWDETIEALGGGFRAIAYDRRGYGDSGAPEDYVRTTVEEQADDLIALLHALDATRAVLCALSFASLACLDVMAREPHLVRAAVLIEPPLLWLVPDGAEAMSGMRATVEEGAAQGGAAGAIDRFAAHVCGPQALDLIGRERLEGAHRAARAFAADFGASARWSLPPRALRELDAPVVVVVGARSERVWHDAARALVDTLPRAELVEAADSGHLVPLEAPELLAETARGIAQP